MKALVLVRWELVQTMRGLGLHVALTLVSLASVGLIGAGIFLLDLWSPFPNTVGTTFRPETTNAPQLSALLGEHRGGLALLVILIWFLLIAALAGPAFSAGAIVRDRRSGRLDRMLTDASRADAVALAKLLAGLVPLVLVLAGAGPSASFAWLIGGLATQEAIASVAVLLAALVLVVAIGLLCSALASTEVTALVTSYFFIGLVFFGPLVASVGVALAGFRATAVSILALDPFVALLTVQSPLAMGLTRALLPEWPGLRLIWMVGKTRVPVWAADVLLYALLAVALVWLTSVVIEPLHPLKTWRLRRADGASR
jgi:hypothetical protein